MTDVEFETPSIEFIHLVLEFREVLHNELSGMPPDRDIDMCINLEPDTHSVSIPPYRMALAGLGELMTQIHKLLYNGFVCPRSFPWGAPILFVKKNDSSMKICIYY